MSTQQPKVIDAAQAPVEQALIAMQEKFAATLPAHVPATRFVRTALSALTNPDIAKCAKTPEGRKSIYDSCLKAATDGLLLDGREAALVKFNVKVGDGWQDRAQYMPMVAGLMKKARNSGEVASIVAQIVYANDDFEINYVTDGPPVTHKPDLSDRGQPLGAYAVARLKDGAWTQPEYMSVDQIEAVRQRSKAKDKGPWQTDWSEMARKTVIRRASKYWPSSTDKDGVSFEEVVRRDDDLIELTPLDTAPTPPAKKRGAARAMLDIAPDEQPHDAETGEIIDAESSPDV